MDNLSYIVAIGKAYYNGKEYDCTDFDETDFYRQGMKQLGSKEPLNKGFFDASQSADLASNLLEKRSLPEIIGGYDKPLHQHTKVIAPLSAKDNIMGIIACNNSNKKHILKIIFSPRIDYKDPYFKDSLPCGQLTGSMLNIHKLSGEAMKFIDKLIEDKQKSSEPFVLPDEFFKLIRLTPVIRTRKDRVNFHSFIIENNENIIEEKGSKDPFFKVEERLGYEKLSPIFGKDNVHHANSDGESRQSYDFVVYKVVTFDHKSSETYKEIFLPLDLIEKIRKGGGCDFYTWSNSKNHNSFGYISKEDILSKEGKRKIITANNGIKGKTFEIHKLDSELNRTKFENLVRKIALEKFVLKG